VTALVVGLALWVALAVAGAVVGVKVARHDGEGGGATTLFGGIGLAVGGLGGLLVMVPFGSYAEAHWNERVVTCTVVSKDRTEDDMRIYTEQCGVFANADSLWRGKTTSGDLWGQIEPGETYDFRVVGWRNGFFSAFPNVLAIEEGP
jgi:hypothetical protein